MGEKRTRMAIACHFFSDFDTVHRAGDPEHVRLLAEHGNREVPTVRLRFEEADETAEAASEAGTR